jgi:electron transport complex protein RnfD
MDLTLYQKPQVNLARSTPDRMWIVAVCCLLAVLQSALGDSFRSLILAASVLAGAFLAEILFNLKDRYWSVKDGSAAASALILTLLLPNTLNPLYGFLGAFFAIAVVKHSFGGLGSNWLNPAAAGWLFIRVAWPAAFAASLENSQLGRLALSLERGLTDPQGSPLAMLKISGWQGNAFDKMFSGFLNNTVLPFFGATLPEGYITFLSAPGPGIIADRGLLMLLLGTVVITASGSIRFWVPIAYLAAYAVLVRIFGALPFGGGLWAGDLLFGLLSGGVFAAAFMLACDPATSPKSSPGICVFALVCGAFGFVFRFPGGETFGAPLAVLLGNALTPLIMRIENALYYDKRRKR